jgi:hypothetical protein
MRIDALKDAAARAVAASLLVGTGAWAAQTPAAGADDGGMAQMRAWTHLSPREIIAVTPTMGLAWLKRGAPGDRAGLIAAVEIQGEVVDETLAVQRGWRSMRLVLDIDCANRKTFVRQFDVYADHDRAGEARNLPAPGGWVRPAQGAYLNAVIDARCGDAPGEAGMAEDARTAPAPTRAPAANAMLVAVKTQPARAPETPAPAPITPRPALKPAPAAAAEPPMVAIQIKASPDQAEAQAALDRLFKRQDWDLKGLTSRIEPAQVRGQTFYRALVVGLDGHAAAKALCGRIVEDGGACFVRVLSANPSP